MRKAKVGEKEAKLRALREADAALDTSRRKKAPKKASRPSLRLVDQELIDRMLRQREERRNYMRDYMKSYRKKHRGQHE